MRIKSALSAREDYALRKYARHRNVTEAGALLGHSTCELGRTARSLASIDRHTGYDGLPNDTLRLYLRNLEVAMLPIKVTAVVGDAITELSKYPADFVFIDLCGTHSVSLGALSAAIAPLVAIHDFARQNCRGVATAIAASGLQIIERIDSMIILRKPQYGYPERYRE